MSHPLWIELESTTSTQDILRELAREGRIQEAVCWAKQQDAGRGRLGRSWLSPEGGLYLSWMTTLQSVPPFVLPPLLALAALDILRPLGVAVGLKWPNDLLALGDGGEEAKLGGILSEYLHLPPHPPKVIVGIGLNLNAEIKIDDLASQPHAYPPISLKMLTQQEHSPREIAGALVERLQSRWQSFLAMPPTMAIAMLREEYKADCWTLGRQIRILRHDGSVLDGLAKEIEEDFSLRLEEKSGRIQPITAGDCLHLRPL
jgi:BirA family biotin operon repressor/biotin-[acetyl-CoA-carboxylase] ligase